MALDDLLARLETDQALPFSGVTRVTRVHPSNDAGFSVTPDANRGVTRVTPRCADEATVTPVTPAPGRGVTAKPAQTLDCTPVTPVTPKKGNVQADSAPPTVAAGWRFHYADRDPLIVWFAPAIDHAEALREEPDAIAAEPISDPVTSTSTEAERAEALAMVQAIYSDDTAQDRQQAIDAALLDPAGALTCYRSIAAARGIEPDAPNSGADAFVRQAVQTGCRSCLHFRRPGLSTGYCASNRPDLAPAYGANHPLRKLPADGGAGCALYEANPRWS